MADPNDGGDLISRLPTLEDLLFLCRKLKRLKQTLRERDAADRFSLQRLVQEQENHKL